MLMRYAYFQHRNNGRIVCAPYVKFRYTAKIIKAMIAKNYGKQFEFLCVITQKQKDKVQSGYDIRKLRKYPNILTHIRG